MNGMSSARGGRRGRDDGALRCWWWWCGLHLEEEGATVRGHERGRTERLGRGAASEMGLRRGSRDGEGEGRDREGEEVMVLRLGSSVREMDEGFVSFRWR